MFGRDKGKPAGDAPPAPLDPGAPESRPQESVLAPSLTVRGDVEFEGAVRIEGQIQGKVTGQGRLTVDPSGRVVGDVMAADVVIQGTVQGNVTAAGCLEVSGTAQIAGDVKATQLVVAHGAKILGRLDIDSESMTLPANGDSRNGGRSAPHAPAQDALEKVL